MEILNIDNIEQNIRVYGGASCKKIGITLNGENYLVKFPGDMKLKGMKNVALSYSNIIRQHRC